MVISLTGIFILLNQFVPQPVYNQVYQSSSFEPFGHNCYAQNKKKSLYWLQKMSLKIYGTNRAIVFTQIAWLRVDTQTILTIHGHVITKNHRIAVTHSDHRTWYLHIKDVRPADRGWYMCQINTDPMKSQVGYLDVVGESF